MLGRSLGNYGVVAKIAEGGMGVVYLARHVTLGRPAAVKVLRASEPADQELVSRFFNEALAATAVRHPGVVEVYDFGFLEDRTAYIMMEYLDGESLAARLRRGRCSIEATLTTVRSIARALQAVHERGIVHRDLKPDNVHLVPDCELPGGERIKLLDFGVAKLTSSATGGHTAPGTVIGTPTYMAPEQCRGTGGVDHRADLYSLGCVAYEMLCGHPPFVAEGPGELIACHLRSEPVSPRRHRGDVWPELEQLVLRLLAKDPAERFGSAAELVVAIDSLMATMQAVGVAGDLVATLSMRAATEVGGAVPATRVGRRAAYGHRLGMLAGGATVGIALIVVLMYFAKSAGFEMMPSSRIDAEAFRRPLFEVLVLLRRAIPGLATLHMVDAGSIAAILSARPRRGGWISRRRRARYGDPRVASACGLPGAAASCATTSRLRPTRS